MIVVNTFIATVVNTSFAIDTISGSGIVLMKCGTFVCAAKLHTIVATPTLLKMKSNHHSKEFPA